MAKKKRKNGAEAGHKAEAEPRPKAAPAKPSYTVPRVAVDAVPLAAMLAHAAANPDVEICGVMVGHREGQGPTAFVHVTASIEGAGADEHGAHVTFKHETWNHIHRVLDEQYPGLEILGWYHSHPGFGVFLSEMDEFIHRSFFTEPHHLALVYDPLAGLLAIFARDGDAMVPIPRYERAGRPVELSSSFGAGGVSETELAGLREGVERVERSLSEIRTGSWIEQWMIPGMLSLIVLMLGFVLFLELTRPTLILPGLRGYGSYPSESFRGDYPGADVPGSSALPRARGSAAAPTLGGKDGKAVAPGAGDNSTPNATGTDDAKTPTTGKH